VVTGDPSTVRHHFLIVATGEVEAAARAEREKVPLTV